MRTVGLAAFLLILGSASLLGSGHTELIGRKNVYNAPGVRGYNFILVATQPKRTAVFILFFKDETVMALDMDHRVVALVQVPNETKLIRYVSALCSVNGVRRRDHVFLVDIGKYPEGVDYTDYVKAWRVDIPTRSIQPAEVDGMRCVNTGH